MFWSIRSVVYISNFGFLVGVFLRGRGPWWNFPKLDGYGVREILQVGAREKLLSPGPTRFLENLNRGSNSRSKKRKWYRQSWTKVWNFFLSASESPHPRFNDEAKTQGEHIIEPGVRGFKGFRKKRCILLSTIECSFSKGLVPRKGSVLKYPVEWWFSQAEFGEWATF